MKATLLLLAALALAACAAPCMPNSTLSGDGGTCVCDCGYVPSPDAGACVPLTEDCGPDAGWPGLVR